VLLSHEEFLNEVLGRPRPSLAERIVEEARALVDRNPKTIEYQRLKQLLIDLDWARTRRTS
jgi:hypothetical protein